MRTGLAGEGRQEKLGVWKEMWKHKLGAEREQSRGWGTDRSDMKIRVVGVQGGAEPRGLGGP